jgi:PAS domain S-box-containing protein
LIYLVDADASLVAVNDAVCQSLGYSLNEMQLLKLYDIDVINDLPTWERAFRRLRSQGSSRFETMYRTRDGGLIPLEITFNYLIYQGKEYCLGIGRDATAQRRMEEELKSSEARFKSIVDDQAEMICRFTPDGTITFINAAFGRFFDKESDRLIGQSFISLLPESEYAAFTSTIEELVADPGKTVYNILPVDTGTGLRWLEHTYRAIAGESGEVRKFQVVMRDITERQKAESALREHEEQYRLIFDTMLDGFAVFEMKTVEDGFPVDACFLEVNPAFERITGLKANDVIGKTLWEVFPTMRLMSADIWKKLITEGKSTNFDELYSMSLKKYLRVNCFSPRKDRYAVMFSDITDSKKMTEQLIRADRLSSLGEMAAGLAHEINNPLTGVLGLSLLLADNIELPQSCRDDARTIYQEANRAGGIVRDFLTFARGHQSERQPASINDIIESVLQLRRTHMRKANIAVETNLAENLPELLIDVSQMQQVIINIILNAEHFMSEANRGGKLRLSSDRINNRVVIKISDDGPGILAEALPHVFDPFFTTKEVGRGTGLGLSISYAIIKEHNGNIYAESNPGNGATFIIELPVLAAQQ